MRARRLLSLGVVASLLAGLAACSVPSPDTAPSAPVADPDAPVVAFYGDSYTRGTGASSTDKRWSSIVSADRGWYEINRSENGLGFVNRREAMGPGLDDIPALIIDDDPDIVFVTMGLNDTFSYDRAAERIRAAIDSDLQRLRDGLPEARIVVVEPFWYTDDRPASVDVIAGWVEAAAARIGADHIDGASRWLEGHDADSAESWMASDGLHPDDTGYAVMAERMDAALRDLDPPL
ncbi:MULTISPECIES: SGNH/GDSL hydrolase family protein [Microbacterium]|uniref:SGNH/GDSL hydrolase family protein n=1 Tax=Microbacterium TaxID=33882 RepID=UPI002784D5AA|nr:MULTISPECIES: SGNH/GDSL hydrolase family protein [Microbacterium]MDQ1082063.1 lysophospholipase L1-like esterase [Microbacterium sp. SORGH_AS_0344]MDQ1169170.1 lysophospholipase L1-like esterase [Microbacterium proteolyticum]